MSLCLRALIDKLSTGRSVGFHSHGMALTAEAADKLFEKATKLTQPSVIALRLRPDWEQATPLFEKAAIAYKVCHGSISTLA